MDEIEERLDRLRNRRIVLEKKITSKMNTMEEFTSIRNDKVQQLIEATKKQNEEARIRNLKLLREFGYAVSSSAKVVLFYNFPQHIIN